MSVKILISAALAAVSVVSFTSAELVAQSPQVPASDLTPRSIKAVVYQVGGGDTKVDLESTPLGAGARGEAKVEARPTVTMVEAVIKDLPPSTKVGTEFLAYVLWAVSPEGRTDNLGEVRPKPNGQATLKATTPLQTFSLVVTAEPYPVVRIPSEMLVLENQVRKNTKGRLMVVENYQLMRRNQYQQMDNPLALSIDLKQAPLEMYQARNAVQIARSRGAETHAPEIFSRAKGGLDLAENALAKKAKEQEIISLARQAIQASEDARALTAERVEAARIASERAAAAAQAKAAAEAKAAQEAEVARQRAAEQAKVQAELAAAREAQLKAEAAAREAQLQVEAATREAAVREASARAEAEAAAREAAVREASARAEAEAAAREASIRAEAERARLAAEALRGQLLEQLNRILETKDTSRGLVVTMADVLFDTGRFELRAPTRESLARLSGVVLAHPGLKFEVEGHTDNTGTDELNQRLSEQRAATVRDYLVQQGLSAGSITAVGYGKTMPVADNSTSAGRQRNRRVEIIVSGEVIGSSIGATGTTGQR